MEVLKAEVGSCKKEIADKIAEAKRNGHLSPVVRSETTLEGTRKPLVEWLGELGSEAKIAVPVLIELSTLVDRDGKTFVADQLERLDPEARKAASEIRRGIQREIEADKSRSGNFGGASGSSNLPF